MISLGFSESDWLATSRASSILEIIRDGSGAGGDPTRLDSGDSPGASTISLGFSESDSPGKVSSILGFVIDDDVAGGDPARLDSGDSLRALTRSLRFSESDWLSRTCSIPVISGSEAGGD
jgi:hypothetical protein